MAFQTGILAALFIASTALGNSNQPGDGAENIRAFADELFAQEEYFRASTEYMRLLSYQPGRADADQVRFRIAQCPYRAGRYSEAAQEFLRLAVSTTSTDMLDRCRLVMAACRYRQDDFPAAAADCARAVSASPKSALLDRFIYLNGMSLAHSGNWTGAFRVFTLVPGGSALAPSSRELGSLCARTSMEKRYSSLATGAMSLVAPGLGQAVCGYGWDGFTAFIMSAGTLAIGLTGLERGNRGMTTAGFALFSIWHPANIIGGANAARRANRRSEERAASRLDAFSTLSLD